MQKDEKIVSNTDNKMKFLLRGFLQIDMASLTMLVLVAVLVIVGTGEYARCTLIIPNNKDTLPFLSSWAGNSRRQLRKISIIFAFVSTDFCCSAATL